MTIEEAIAIIKEAPLYNDTTYEFANKLHEAIKTLEQELCDIPYISAEKWIPVSERLPDIHNYSNNYLVTLKRGGIQVAMFTECDGNHWWAYDDVVAWMPLPRMSYKKVKVSNE